MKKMYSSKTELTTDVCLLIGWSPVCRAIETMQRGSVIYARATLLHPNEVADFQSLDGKTLNGCRIKIMNFRKD